MTCKTLNRKNRWAYLGFFLLKFTALGAIHGLSSAAPTVFSEMRG